MVDGSELRSLEPTLPGDGLTVDDAALTGGSGRQGWTEAEVPDRLGRFVVERRLGVGGMGAVFEGHDPLLDRPVALKLLRGQARLGEQTRLRREAQALARLSHPNVVQVFEAGVHEGRAYIAMEVVDGVSLDAWLAGQPRTPDEILDVFLQAGEGLAAAHAAGFVHRDFKPGNAMVGADGRVRVLDFGLAWADPMVMSNEELPEVAASEPPAITWSHDLTRTGAMLGTPAYMSPEQLWAKPVTEASDQFSFCVALHQALFGQHPFADEHGVLEPMGNASADRLRPAPASRAVPAGVRHAVLQGLAHAPEDRWPSMKRLLDELRRGRRPPAWRRTLGLGALAVAVLAGGAWLWGAWDDDPTAALCSGADAKLDEVWGPEPRARVEQALLATDLPYAGSTWAEVQRRLDDHAASWRSTYQQACEATASGSQPSSRLDAQLACLERLRGALGARVEVLAAADPTVAQQAVAAVAGLPRSETCLDPPPQPLLLPPDDPEGAVAYAAFEQQLERTAALLDAGKYADALTSAEQADQAARALQHPPSEARAALRLGLAQHEAGSSSLAEGSLERAYFLARELGDDVVARRAAVALVQIVGLGRQDYERGLEWSRHAEIEAERSSDPLAMVDVLSTRGMVLSQQGEQERALAEVEAALATYRAQGSIDPLEEAGLLADLGMVQRRLDRHDEAIRTQERALAATEAALGPTHPQVAGLLGNLSAAYFRGKRRDEAEQAARRAVAIEEAALGPTHPHLANTLNNLSIILLHQRHEEEAEQMIERSIAITEATGTEPHNLALAVANLAFVQHERGRYAAAARSHRRSIALFEEAGLERHPDLAFKLAMYASTLEQLHDYDAAEAALQRALAIVEGDDEHADVSIEVLIRLASVAAASGRWQDAIDHAERVLAPRPGAPLIAPHRAVASFALARALWESRPEARARAIELARQADRDAASVKRSYAGLREDIAAWLSEHAPAGEAAARSAISR